jgi:hypothetical protein
MSRHPFAATSFADEVNIDVDICRLVTSKIIHKRHPMSGRLSSLKILEGEGKAMVYTDQGRWPGYESR